jgi:hypothetical protein
MKRNLLGVMPIENNSLIPKLYLMIPKLFQNRRHKTQKSTLIKKIQFKILLVINQD